VSDLFSTLRQAEVQFAVGGTQLDVTSIVLWWQRPIHDTESLATLCLSSKAEALFIDGVRKTTAAFVSDPSLRELMACYMTFACALTVDPESRNDFVLPLWLCWIRDTAKAVRLWGALTARLALPDLIREFVSLAWLRGIQSICAAYPRVAIRYWSETAEQLWQRAQHDTAKLLNLAGAFREAQQLAMDLGLGQPECCGDVADGAGLLEAIDGWRKSELLPRLDSLFWESHLPFLSRTRSRRAPPLKRGRKAKLTQLINSATRSGPPALLECLALCRAHDEVLEEILIAQASHRKTVSGPQ
jgi:hypothetical protein